MPPSVSEDSSLARTSPLAGNAKQRSPAFQGASRAFNANAGAVANGFTGANGALAAASFVGGGGRGQLQTFNNEGRSSLSRQNTGQSIRSRDASPSYAAASLAASQASNRPSHSQSPALSHRQSWRRPSPLQKIPTGSSTPRGQNEEMPSPATKSLVQLYESKQTASSQKTQSVRYVSKPGPPIRSPKPVRPLSRTASSASVIADRLQPPLSTSRPHASLDGPSASHHGAAAAATKLAGPAFGTAMDTPGGTYARREAPHAPPPR